MKALAEQIGELDGVEIYGRVVGVRGLMVEVAGPIHAMSVGARVMIETGNGRGIPCEVVGFSGGMRWPCRSPRSKACGAAAGRWCRRRRQRCGRRSAGSAACVNAMGEPIDGKGPLPPGPAPYPFRTSPPPAHARRRVGAPLDLGVRALNTFVTCLPRPAHGHLRRLRRRQVGAAVDAGAQRGGRRVGHWPGRRTRPRGAGVPAGRSRRGGSGALGGGGLDLRRAGADAPPGRLSHAGDRRISSATWARTCWC